MSADDLTLYLNAVIGDSRGFLHTAVGVGGFFDQNGRYSHRRWIQKHYRWPEQRSAAVAELLSAAQDSDAYVCPYLMVGDKRAQGAAAGRWIVHADLDGGMFDAEKAEAVNGFAVASGSEGNAHVYVALAEPVPAHWHRELCRGLGEFLGAADSKISDNDVLRPPGTRNHKRAARGGDADAVAWLVRPDSTRWEPRALAAILGVNLPEQATATAPRGNRQAASAAVEPVDLDAMPELRAVVGINTDDRSTDTMRIVGACRDHGLTLAQARAVVNSRADLAERLAGRTDDDVLECWLKVVDSRQHRQWAAAPVEQITNPAQGHPETPDAPRPAPVSLIALSDVKPERVEWLWPNRIPRGKLVTLDGDPGLGKSTLALAITGPITTAGQWPDGTRCEHPGAVLLLSAEDGLADTVRPRLDAAGADVTRVHAIQGVPEVDRDGNVGLRPPTLGDILALREAIVSTGAALLIVDVLMAYLPSGSDAHKDQDVRAILGRLTKLAEETGCTIILIRHLNKSTGRDPLYRGGGSIGIVGAGRVALLVAADPDDEERRVLAGMKSNLGPLPEALAYRLVSAGDYGVARVQWEGAVEHTAHTLLSERGNAQEASAATEAEMWLEDYLAQNGSARSADAKREAAKLKISERTLQRAAEKLGVTTRSEGFPRVTWWALPSPATDDQPTPDTQNLGATGATGDDQHKQNGATGPKTQSRQSLCDGATEPPGGVTDRTPGMTPAVERALAAARSAGRFSADPPCFYCDKPVASKTKDDAGRYVHLGCAQAASGAEILL